jgi:hypothetical protein
MQLELQNGELVIPTLRRSVDELRRAVLLPGCQELLEIQVDAFHPLKLAVGWPDGIRILLAAGCFTMEAIEIAIHRNDVESLDILLSDWSERPSDWWPENMPHNWLEIGSFPSCRRILEYASWHGGSEVHHCVVRHINRALSNLDRLVTKSVGTGKMIEELPVSLRSNAVSVYHLWDTQVGALKLLDALYESGITSIDSKNVRQETPLLYRLNKYSAFDEFVPEAITWFLHKGANPNFYGQDFWPNIHFYLPLVMELGETIPSRIEDISPLYSSLCDPLQIDGCQCYCSSNGCLPFHQTLTCRLKGSEARWHENHCLHRARVKWKSLEDWARMNGLEDRRMKTLCAEASRVEVFDRLGMAHTCCSVYVERDMLYRGSAYKAAWRIVRHISLEDERERLQEEDEELRKQLDMIMNAYNRMQQMYSGSLEEFWEAWWQILDEILQDLMPVERCRLKGHLHWTFETKLKDLGREQELGKEQELDERRAKREEEALRESGYLGMDFSDVIQLHFAQYLS